jgi:hypothetical protein
MKFTTDLSIVSCCPQDPVPQNLPKTASHVTLENDHLHFLKKIHVFNSLTTISSEKKPPPHFDISDPQASTETAEQKLIMFDSWGLSQ